MPREDCAATSGEQSEPVVQACSDLFDCQDLHPRRRQFNRQGHAIQAVANLRHSGRVLACDSKLWGGRHRPIDEEAHGLVQDKILGRWEMACVG